jgi:hypothetical protein
MAKELLTPLETLPLSQALSKLSLRINSLKNQRTSGFLEKQKL